MVCASPNDPGFDLRPFLALVVLTLCAVMYLALLARSARRARDARQAPGGEGEAARRKE